MTFITFIWHKVLPNFEFCLVKDEVLPGYTGYKDLKSGRNFSLINEVFSLVSFETYIL